MPSATSPAALIGGSAIAHATAPMSGKQAPGFYRFKLGEYEKTMDASIRETKGFAIHFRLVPQR